MAARKHHSPSAAPSVVPLCAGMTPPMAERNAPRLYASPRAVLVREAGTYPRAPRPAYSASTARRSRETQRSFPSAAIVSNSGGAAVRPVTATRIAPKSCPVRSPSRSANAL